VDKRGISVNFPYGKSAFWGEKCAYTAATSDFHHQRPQMAKKYFPFTNN
jgi:hypothetical protein